MAALALTDDECARLAVEGQLIIEKPTYEPRIGDWQTTRYHFMVSPTGLRDARVDTAAIGG